MVMPGDNIEMTVELIAPVAIEEGTKFSIREGGRTVGAGSIIYQSLNNIIYKKQVGDDPPAFFCNFYNGNNVFLLKNCIEIDFITVIDEISLLDSFRY